jgi:hypothetical protein
VPNLIRAVRLGAAPRLSTDHRRASSSARAGARDGSTERFADRLEALFREVDEVHEMPRWVAADNPEISYPFQSGTAAVSLSRVQVAPPGKSMETLNEMFEETLKDVYFAENAIIKTLPKMTERAQSEDLKAAFEEHPLEETQGSGQPPRQNLQNARQQG